MELSRLLLLLLPWLCFSQEKVVNKTVGINLRIPSLCSTTSGDVCQFPFIYKGQRYTRCTFTNSPTPWCATMLDQNGNAVTNRWGDCSITDRFSSCETDTPKQSGSSCITIGGPTPNKQCIFPFRFEGVTHTSCTTVNINQPWCSTATLSDGYHITGQYGLCPSSCSGSGGKLTATSCRVTSGPATGRQCVFPFSYNGKTYQGCTPWTFGGTNQGKAWCSTRTDGQGAHVNGGGNYGFCGQGCPAATAGEGFIKSRINLERNEGIVFEEDNALAPN